MRTILKERRYTYVRSDQSTGRHPEGSPPGEGPGDPLFLMNGFQLRGTIIGYDSFVVVLVSDGRQQMIYKHAISTLVPMKPLKAAIPAV